MSKFDDKKLINDIRSLSIDMINNAKSGHPGISLGAATILHTLFSRQLKFHSGYSNWCNRDRFIMSAGHGSALLYANLFVNGYDYTIDDLSNFRKLNSKTPGHPEYNLNCGIEMTTGPLGQGFGTSVGMAIAEKFLASTFNTKKYKLFDYNIFVLCGDGDLMEGINYEAISLAANLNLNNLIVLYDSNNITLDGKLNLSFNENVIDRFTNMGWNTIEVFNGESINEINGAIKRAKKSKKKPTLIKINTTIGKYSILENTNKVHGTPLSQEDITQIKKRLKVNDVPFSINEENINNYLNYICNKNKESYNKWKVMFDEYTLDKNNNKDLLLSIINKEQIVIKLERLIDLNNIDNNLSMRNINEIIMNKISDYISEFIGGCADTVSSTKTYLNEKGIFSPLNYGGRNIYYGIREHVMAASTNGLALSNLKGFCSTFLSFADYMKPSIRLSALMNIPSTFIFTHDSINIGEDGPTHQPIEQLGSLRSIPNFSVYRPYNKYELVGCWNNILEESKPCSLIISRNNVLFDVLVPVSKIKQGGYIISEYDNSFDLIIMASGSEVDLAFKVKEKLSQDNIGVRIVSVPNLNIFLNQDKEYINEILPSSKKVFVIEYSNDTLWYKLGSINKIFNMNSFGKSGNREEVIKYFNLDADSIYNNIKIIL